MSGHNKWSQIKRKKAVTDAQKSKIFSKLARLIVAQARIVKGDTNSPILRAVIGKARKANMPIDNIERAVKKALEPSAQMEEIIYEAYGPGGVGIIIETLTDNRNRTAQEIKYILSKNEASLAGIGAVKWAFSTRSGPTSSGQNLVPTTTVSLSDEDLNKLDKLVDALEELDDVQEVFTNAE